MNAKETQSVRDFATVHGIPIRVTQVGKTTQYSVTIPRYNPRSFIYDKALAETYLVCLIAFTKF